jgi:hypothetical protein
MSVTNFGDPHQVIHIPARDLTGTREAKLWSWPAMHLRAVLRDFSPGSTPSKNGRS